MYRTLGRLALVLTVPLLVACATGMTPLDQGVAYYLDGRFESALVSFDEAVRLAPQDAAAWNDRGLARLRLGQHVEALGDLTKAIELAPLDPELYFNRGNVYMALANYDYAVQDYNRAVALSPAYGKAYFNRGTARLRLGDRGGADADWRYAALVETDGRAQATMVRSARLVGTTTVATAAPPSPAPIESSPSAIPAFRDEPAAAVDTDALAMRGVSRALQGDRQGATGDLREAVIKAKDPQQRAVIERLLRAVESQ